MWTTTSRVPTEMGQDVFPTTEAVQKRRGMLHESKIAWNLRYIHSEHALASQPTGCDITPKHLSGSPELKSSNNSSEQKLVLSEVDEEEQDELTE
ncbi:hypothetical protein FQA47_004155 [Oryzias melastigma]|uniref:Uncharacterized protein n=1 Tax=Oryzias melastigma TaxID=30732 RepID=A0A834C208_ORYME|nr:hypothetical protein FQA47_004155 [Oryzias melastigma]